MDDGVIPCPAAMGIGTVVYGSSVAVSFDHYLFDDFGLQLFIEEMHDGGAAHE